MLLSGCITANALNKGNNVFNDDNWNKITNGMSKDEVINLIGKPTNILVVNTENLTTEDWDYIQSVKVYNPRLLVPFLNIDTKTGELVNEGDLYQVSAHVSFGKDGGVIQYSRQKSVDEVKYVPSNSPQSTQSNNTKLKDIPRAFKDAIKGK
jgi:outer membrane protein assembly factor BamE (lipoprotein component of BamABCDE complex)